MPWFRIYVFRFLYRLPKQAITLNDKKNKGIHIYNHSKTKMETTKPVVEILRENVDSRGYNIIPT